MSSEYDILSSTETAGLQDQHQKLASKRRAKSHKPIQPLTSILRLEASNLEEDGKQRRGDLIKAAWQKLELGINALLLEQRFAL